MVEETVLIYKQSFSADDVRVSGMSAVSSSSGPCRNAVCRAAADVIPSGQQQQKPEKSPQTLPTSLERSVFPETGITAYRLAA